MTDATSSRSSSDEAPTADAPKVATLPRARSTQRTQERRQRAQQAPRRLVRNFVALPKHINPVATFIFFCVVAVLVLSISTPLRNYFQQRSELEGLRQQIATQERRKAELTEELNRFNNEDYVKEQARIRLGVIEPGESAFRIISPKIRASGAGNDTPGDAQARSAEHQDEKPWYGKLWDSIAVPQTNPEPASGPGEVLRVPTVDDKPAGAAKPGGGAGQGQSQPPQHPQPPQAPQPPRDERGPAAPPPPPPPPPAPPAPAPGVAPPPAPAPAAVPAPAPPAAPPHVPDAP